MLSCAILVKNPIPPYVEGIRQRLSKKGIDSALFDWDNLDDDNLLRVEDYPALFIADAANCPAFLPNKLLCYLKSGGRVVTAGGPPFLNEFYSLNNEEITLAELSRRLSDGDFDKAVIAPFDSPEELCDFTFDATNPDNKKLTQTASLSIVDGGVTSKSCLCYKIDSFYINESFEKPIRLKEGHNVLGFWASGDENTKTITIELLQENGDIFKTRITPEPSFNYFLLCAKDFSFAGNNKNVTYTKKARPSAIKWEQVCAIRFGHALSHAYSVAGRHCFYIDELSSGRISVLNDKSISIDGLYPPCKFYPVTNAAIIKSYEKQAILPQMEYPIPHDLFSFSPRAQATGIDKARRCRFIPLIEVCDTKGLHSGYAAYMLLNYSYGDRCAEADGSAIAVFSTNDDNFYQNGGDEAVALTIAAMTAPAILLEGGGDEYIYKDDNEAPARYGAVVLVRRDAALDDYRLKITVEQISSIYTLSELLTVKTQGEYDFRCVTFEQAPSAGEVSVSLMLFDKTLDVLTHNVIVLSQKPEDERRFADIPPDTNEIFIAGQPVRFFGINYMPSCNAGMETFEEFEHYVSAFAYDPDIIENDIKRIAEIGINAVSIFMHYEPSIHSNNILHLMQLCKAYGIYVTLSLRPHANPFDFNADEIKQMITRYSFDADDNLVGYDIAWERYVGTYEPCYGNFEGRKMFDSAWRGFLLRHYGSFEAASRLFGCQLPKNKRGEVISPSDDMLRKNDGAEASEAGLSNIKLVAVYRRFIDHEVALAHIRACDFIRSIDPNHLITARSGDASGIPLVDPGIYGYDFKATAAALDFLSPESYALSEDNDSMRQGVFTNIYSRYANKNAVVQWMEFGKSIWIGSNFVDNTVSLQFQADYYRDFFDMLMMGHTSGLYAWWWAGGYRYGENSDFGIISPDGSDRPVTKVFREYAMKFLNAPPLPKPDYHIFIDRDANADGIRSIYRNIENELFDAISHGHTVSLIDGGFGKNSANADISELDGASRCEGSLKFLDGLLISCSAILDDGSHHLLQNGDTLHVLKSKAVIFSFEFMNTESPTWLCGDEVGSVSLEGEPDSLYPVSLPIYSDLPRHGRVSFHLTIPCEEKGRLACRLCAKGRTRFGERVEIELV